MKFRAKSVDNTDHLFLSSSPKNVNNSTSTASTSASAFYDRRLRMKHLSTSPNRLNFWQPLSVNVNVGVGVDATSGRRRLSKRSSLDSGMALGRTNEPVEAEPRKPPRWLIRFKKCLKSSRKLIKMTPGPNLIKNLELRSYAKLEF